MKEGELSTLLETCNIENVVAVFHQEPSGEQREPQIGNRKMTLWKHQNG